jgi:hypothetical protein
MRLIVATALIAAAMAGCTPATSSPSVEPSVEPSVGSTVPPTASVDPAAQPPTGMLNVDGGDPIPGALGSFEWLDSGSASPWLPGAPINVGAGEVARVSLDPPLGIVSWRARVAARADGDGARRLADGLDQVSFGVPEPGDWTVEVTVQFADGVGSAAYYWRMTVQ